MRNYVGAKIVRAEPMDECTFLRTVKHEDTGNRETRSGYVVTYPNDAGPYQSWSPKEVFEQAYRPVSDAEARLFNQ